MGSRREMKDAEGSTEMEGNPEVAASRGTEGGFLSPEGLRSWGGGTPRDRAALPVPALTCCLVRRWRRPMLFWVPSFCAPP